MNAPEILAVVAVVGALGGAGWNVALCRLAGDPIDWRFTAGVAAVSATVQCVSASFWILSGGR